MKIEELKTLLQDPTKFKVNTLKPHSDHEFYLDLNQAYNECSSPFKYDLNGDWKFRYDDNLNTIDLNFYKLDHDCSDYNTIKVPGHIQLQGYGKCHYVNTQYPWDGHNNLTPGQIPDNFNPTGSYVKEFKLTPRFNNKPIIINLGGVECAFNLWLNGHYVGYSEDSFTPTEFDLTPYINYGGVNKLAIQVYKYCAGSWLEDQDFWRFSGIFRDVYLYTIPKTHIRDLEIKTNLTNNYSQAEVNVKLNIINPSGSINAKLKYESLKIDSVTLPITDNVLNLTFNVENTKLWSDEFPNLYQLELEVIDNEEVIEAIVENVGIREFKIIDNVMCLNGKRIVFRGVNRHEFSHVNGRAITKEEMEWDIEFLKNNNFNAIRTSHYPNHSYIYKLCDKYGLYVVDEVNLETHGSFMEMGEICYDENTIPDDHPQWLDIILDRASSMLERDKNHPSIIIWSCGNESYGGKNLQIMHDYFKERDDSRIVQYEGVFFDRRFNDTSDIESRMYAYPSHIKEYLDNNPTKPFVNIEYAHAMGNSCGNMDEYTKLSEEYPMYQGGFIWDYIDQAILTTDIYGNEYLAFGGDFMDQPTDYNFCINGIIYADRRPSAKMQAIKGDFAPFKITFNDNQLTIKNKMMFTNLSNYVTKISFSCDEQIVNEFVSNVDLLPGEEKTFNLDLNYEYNDELVVTCSIITNKDKDLIKSGNEIACDQLIVRKEQDIKHETKPYEIVEGGVNIGIHGDGFEVLFAKNLGRIVSLVYDGVEYIHQPKQSLMPSFWRASTDNDRGNGSDYRMAIWKIASLYQEVASFDYKQVSDGLEVVIKYNLPTTPTLQVSVTYLVHSDGVIDVELDYPGSDNLPNMFKFGMDLSINPEFDRFNWLGYGPDETYSDRLYGAKYGRYKKMVVDNFSEYLIPQECGNHSNTKEFSVLNSYNRGIKFSSNEEFDFSILPWTSHELENAYHIHDLPDIYKTVISINKYQMGVGGDDSWGARIHTQYEIEANKPYKFKFSISKVK